MKYTISKPILERRIIWMGTSKEYDKIALWLAKVLSDKLRTENATMPIVRITSERCKYPDEVFVKNL